MKLLKPKFHNKGHNILHVYIQIVHIHLTNTSLLWIELWYVTKHDGERAERLRD